MRYSVHLQDLSNLCRQVEPGAWRLWSAPHFNPRLIRFRRTAPRDAEALGLARDFVKPKKLIVIATVPHHDETKLVNFFEVGEKAKSFSRSSSDFTPMKDLAVSDITRESWISFERDKVERPL